MWMILGSLAMGCGVALGAFGAHILKPKLTPELYAAFQTGVLYHLIHGLVLFMMMWLVTLGDRRLVTMAGWAFVIGIVLFSGSLYLLSMTGVHRYGMLTPVGGVAFLVGWGLLAVARMVR